MVTMATNKILNKLSGNEYFMNNESALQAKQNHNLVVTTGNRLT